MSSGLPLKADVAGCRRHVSNLPAADMQWCARCPLARRATKQKSNDKVEDKAKRDDQRRVFARRPEQSDWYRRQEKHCDSEEKIKEPFENALARGHGGLGEKEPSQKRLRRGHLYLCTAWDGRARLTQKRLAMFDLRVRVLFEVRRCLDCHLRRPGSSAKLLASACDPNANFVGITGTARIHLPASARSGERLDGSDEWWFLQRKFH